MEKKKARGTVSCYRDDEKHWVYNTHPLTVLKHYSDVKNLPGHYLNNAAYEIATVMEWAYKRLADCSEDYPIEIKFRIK